eukprot:m.8595 g.8595  ORF g.8595 m.8595 type:complete len:882 (+) comp5254_c0_seq2:82-2727(+)
MEQGAALLALPIDILRLIVSFLDVESRGRLARVSRLFSEICAFRTLVLCASHRQGEEQEEGEDDLHKEQRIAGTVDMIAHQHPQIAHLENVEHSVLLAVLASPALAYLDISDQHLDESEITAVRDLLQHDTLRVLALNNVGLTTLSIRGVCDALLSLKNLHVLSVGSNRLTNYGVTAVGWTVGQHKHLSALDLHATACDWDAMVRLETFLAKSKLRELDVSRNPLGDAGARACAPLATHKTLVYLDLSHSHIGCDGIRAIAEKMAGGSRLQVLLLAHNRVGREGTEALARVLPDTRLVHLSLSGNPGPSLATSALVAALRRCRGLRVLELASCSLGESEAEAIASAAGASPGPLHDLDLRDNALHPGGPAALTRNRLLQARPALLIHLDEDDVTDGARGERSVSESDMHSEPHRVEHAAVYSVGLGDVSFEDARGRTGSGSGSAWSAAASATASPPPPTRGRWSRSPALSSPSIHSASAAGAAAMAVCDSPGPARMSPISPSPRHARISFASPHPGLPSPPVARSRSSQPMDLTTTTPPPPVSISSSVSSHSLASMRPQSGSVRQPSGPPSPYAGTAFSVSTTNSNLFNQHQAGNTSAWAVPTVPQASFPSSSSFSAIAPHPGGSTAASSPALSLASARPASASSHGTHATQHSADEGSPSNSSLSSGPARPRIVKFTASPSEDPDTPSATAASRAHHRSYSPTPPPLEPHARDFEPAASHPLPASFVRGGPGWQQTQGHSSSGNKVFGAGVVGAGSAGSFVGVGPRGPSPSLTQPIQPTVSFPQHPPSLALHAPLHALPHPSGIAPSYHPPGLARDSASPVHGIASAAAAGTAVGTGTSASVGLVPGVLSEEQGVPELDVAVGPQRLRMLFRAGCREAKQ